MSRRQAGSLARVWLRCTRHCGGELFKALSAEVTVDSAGRYQDHEITLAGYACLNCGAPALDLSAVPGELELEAAEDLAPVAVDVLCPMCETGVSILPGDECPNCGAALIS